MEEEDEGDDDDGDTEDGGSSRAAGRGRGDEIDAPRLRFA